MRVPFLLTACLALAPVLVHAASTPGTAIVYPSISGWHTMANWSYSDTREPDPPSPGPQTVSISTSYSTPFWHYGYGREMEMSVSASFVGTAAIGSLHAAASTTAEGFRNAGANISTGGGVEFWDFFTVTGTPGQSVQVSWRADLHGVRACSGDPELSPSGLARLTYSVFNTNPFGGGNERGDRALSACGDNTLSDSGVMYLEVGDRMQVFAHLQVSASNGDAMDAGNTARLFFDTLTPGTSLVSTSGHNYSITAVPEPGSWLLMGLGLTGLFVRQGRRGLSRSRA